MRGKPKFKEGDDVIVTFDNNLTIKGYVYIVDKWGTFENPSDVSYDVMQEGDKMLYKHIPECLLSKAK